MKTNVKGILLEHFSRIGKAMSNPGRLELIDLLCQGEKSVETLASQSNLSVKNVSAQLKVLKSANLVDSRKEGKYIYYFLADESVLKFWLSLQEVSQSRLFEIQAVINEYFHNPDEMVKLDLESLIAEAKKGEIVVIDVRPPDEYSLGHIPYAKSVPLSRLTEKKIKLAKNKKIVAYCRGACCVLSVEAVKWLNENGYKATRTDAGISEWKASGVKLMACS